MQASNESSNDGLSAQEGGFAPAPWELQTSGGKLLFLT